MVRAYRPNALRMSFLEEGAVEREMDRIHKQGVFQIWLPERTLPIRYLSVISYPQGA